MYQKLKFAALLLSLQFLVSSCLEHKYSIRVYPNDSVDLNYTVGGDRLDFDDEGQLFPDTSQWNVESRIEYHEDETEHIYEYEVLNQYYSKVTDLLFWERSMSDSIHLRKSVIIEKRHRLFGTEWIYAGLIFGRRFDELYGDIWSFVPDECRILEDEDELERLPSDEIAKLEERFALGILQWNHQRYLKRFDRMWKIIKRSIPNIEDKSDATFSIARTAWQEYLHLYMNGLDLENPSLIDLEWWDDLRPTFLGYMTDLAGTDSLALIRTLGETLEDEYMISKDLEDDMVNFEVKLPGIVIKTDGTREEDGWLSWEFHGKELLSADGIMYARSFDLNIWRIGIAAFLAVLIISLSRRYMQRRRSSDDR